MHRSIALLLLISLVACAAPPSRQLAELHATCGDGASVRSVVGPTPLVTDLWAHLRSTSLPTWKDGEFETQEFRYIGQVAAPGPLHVVWFSTTWGQACRTTNRLLLFDDSLKLAGAYSGIADRPVSTSGTVLRFDNGDTVSFAGGLPARMDDVPLVTGW